MSGQCYETANLYYDVKDYKKSFNICMEVLTENANKFKETGDADALKDNLKLSTLAVKALLFQLSDISDEKENKLLTDAVILCFRFVKTIDEWCWFENEILTALYEWEKIKIQNTLLQIKNNIDFDLYKKYINIRFNFISKLIGIDAMIRNLPVIEEYCNNKGISTKEFLAEHDKTKPKSKQVSDDEVALMNYQAAAELFEDIKLKLDKYADVNLEVAGNVTEALCTEYMLAFLLAETFVGKSTSETALNCIKLSAEIEHHFFEAKIYPNGKPLSVFRGNRENQLNTSLKKKYEKILKLDPDFEVPHLPSVEAVNLPTQKSGGCYVATAVYGSYDCPEVWTLRRFRDNILAKNFLGRLFIMLYYAVSPTLVKWFGETQWFRNMWKPVLDNKVKKLNLNGVEDTPYNDRQW